MANVLSGGGNNINFNGNISGPSNSYGNTIGVNKGGPNKDTFPGMIADNGKNTEEFNFNSSIYEIELERNKRLSEKFDSFESFNNIMNAPNKYEKIMENVYNVSSNYVETDNITVEQTELVSKETLEGTRDYCISIKNNMENEKKKLEEDYYAFLTTSEYSNRYHEGLYYDEYDPNGTILDPISIKKSGSALRNWLYKNGYPTEDVWVVYNEEDYKRRLEYQKGVEAFNKFVDNEYTKIFSKYFEEYMGITYEEYVNKVNTMNNDISLFSAAIYNFEDQIRMLPYLEIMQEDTYLHYLDSLDGTLDGKIADNIDMDAEINSIFDLARTDEQGEIWLKNFNFLFDNMSYITDDEKKMISYLIYYGDYDKALEYLSVIEDDVNQRKGKEEADKFIASITGEDGKIDSNLLNSLKTSGVGILDGIENFGEGLYNSIYAEGKISVNQYAQMYILEALAKQESSLSFDYNLGMAAGNMLPSMTISAIVSLFGTPLAGKIVGSTLMGVSSAGNARNQALIEGNGEFVSVIYGLLNGLSETTLEYFLGNMPGLSKTAKFGLEIFNEGVEEFTQTYIDAILSKVLLGEDINLEDLFAEGGNAFIYGICLSSFFTGGQCAINVMSNGVSTYIDNVKFEKLMKLIKSVDCEFVKIDGKDVIIFNNPAAVDLETINQLKQLFPNVIIGKINYAGLIELDTNGGLSIQEQEVLRNNIAQNMDTFPLGIEIDALNYRGEFIVPSGGKAHVLSTIEESSGGMKTVRYFVVDSNGQYIGMADFNKFNNTNHVSIDYQVSNEFQGRNYGISMLNFIVKDIFTNNNGNINIEKINLQIENGNIASQKIAGKIGFERIGDGRYQLTKEDYLAYKNGTKEIIPFEINDGKSNLSYADGIDTSDIEKINSLNVTNMRSILADNTFVNKYKSYILDKIIQVQDSIFLNTDFLNVCGIVLRIKEIIGENNDFYTLLSDENLIRMFAFDPTNTHIINEIVSRVNSGSHMFARYSVVSNVFGLEINDSLKAFSKIDENTQKKVLEFAKEDWNCVPDDIKKYDYGNTFFGQALLGRMIREGRINEKGLNIIRKLNSKNPNILKCFNFEILDDNILSKLDIDYIMEVGVYGILSSKIVALSKNETVFNAFVNIVNNSKLDDSLSTFYTKTECCLNYLLENINNLNDYSSFDLSSDTFVNYILFNKNRDLYEWFSERIQISYDDNYILKFRNECDRLFAEATSIEKMKDIYYQKYFSLTSYDIKSYISKYADDIEAVAKYDENQEVITILEFFKKIEETEDMEYIRKLYEYMNYFVTAEEMLRFDSMLKKLYAQSYIEELSKTSNNILNGESYTYISYNGKEVRFIEAGTDFSFIVHSNGTGFRSAKTSLAGNSYVTDWYNISNPTVHGLATSYITPSNIGSAPVQDSGVLYGFTNIDASNIVIMAPYDVNSHIADYGFKSGKQQKYISARNMSNNTFRVYNEIVLDRISVKPDCVIIYDDSSQQMIDNAFKAASDWGIPVVRINKLQLATQQAEKINSLIDDFRTTGNIQLLSEAINLYEANVSGYKLNSYVKEGARDATSSINNDIVGNIFKPEKIETSVIEYLDKATSIKEINSVIEVLESIKFKYDLVNENGTMLVANTKSGIDIESLLKYAKQKKGSIYE